MPDIGERVRSIVAEKLGRNEVDVRPEAALVEDLDADKLNLAELRKGIEKEFEVDITDDDAQGLKTVQSLIDFVTAHRTT
jgi:acyl carrier protein